MLSGAFSAGLEGVLARVGLDGGVVFGAGSGAIGAVGFFVGVAKGF